MAEARATAATAEGTGSRAGRGGSVWTSTAGTGETFPSFEGDQACDVAVIGAGFCGLSAAHHLLRFGREVTVLEAATPGWGASGRNGGMALPLWKSTYAQLADSQGQARAREMHALGLQAVDLVEALVRHYAIDCDFQRYGHITAAYRAADLDALRAARDRMHADLGDDAPSLLGRDEMNGRLGTNAYVGGYFEPRGAGLHPLKFSRGMARGVAGAGARVFEASPVNAVREAANGVALDLDRGTLVARHVLVCTNAYGMLGLLGMDPRRSFVPVVTSVIATSPLPPGTDVLRSGHLVSDTKRILNYFRLAPNGGLLFGGRGVQRDDDPPASARALGRKMRAVFPQLGGQDIAYHWSGRVAVTRNGLPCVGRIGDRIHYAFGFNGRGVALANLAGAGLARALVPDATDLPAFPRFDPPRVPPRFAQAPLTTAVMRWHELLDRMKV